MTIKKYKILYDAKGRIFGTQEVTPDQIKEPMPNKKFATKAKSNTPSTTQVSSQKKTPASVDFMKQQQGVALILGKIAQGQQFTSEQAAAEMTKFYQENTQRSLSKIDKSVRQALFYLKQEKYIT